MNKELKNMVVNNAIQSTYTRGGLTKNYHILDSEYRNACNEKRLAISVGLSQYQYVLILQICRTQQC